MNHLQIFVKFDGLNRFHSRENWCLNFEDLVKHLETLPFASTLALAGRNRAGGHTPSIW